MTTWKAATAARRIPIQLVREDRASLIRTVRASRGGSAPAGFTRRLAAFPETSQIWTEVAYIGLSCAASDRSQTGHALSPAAAKCL